MEGRKKMLRHIFWALLLATVFFAGWQARGQRSFQHGFETGYEAAASHISTRIRAGMKEMEPFYISDIGFRFFPRGYTIASLRFIGDETACTAKAEVRE